MTTRTQDPTTMITSTGSASGPEAESRPRIGEVRRGLALARAETILLLRNKTALFMALAMPLLMAVMFGGLLAGIAGSLAGPLLGMIIGSSLLFVVYYTLVTSVVARRDEHTLKRLYTGSMHPATILIAMAAPLAVLLVAQVGLGSVAIGILFGFDAPVRLLLLVPALVGGAAAWWALALASTGPTRNVEAAQLTTLPMILVALGLSGLSLPLALLPEGAQLVAQLTPMFPVVDLAFLAVGTERVTGATVHGPALLATVGVDVAVLAGWVAVALLAARRSFCWEPRR